MATRPLGDDRRFTAISLCHVPCGLTSDDSSIHLMAKYNRQPLAYTVSHASLAGH